MNKRDFYKQLMSEYTFDAETIKANAKKGRTAKQKALPMYIGMTAAAAVCTVAVGTAAMTMLGDKGGVTLIQDGGLAALPAAERLEKALEEIKANADSSVKHDVLVSFSRPLSSAEVQAVLTRYTESIPVKQLWFADGTKTSGTDNISAIFNGGGSGITGAVVNCTGVDMNKLQEDYLVHAVEIVTAKDMENAAPINPNEIGAETVEVVVPDDIPDAPVTAPTEPYEPVTDVTEPVPEKPVEPEQPAESEPVTDEAETVEPEEPVTSETVDAPEIDEPVEPEQPEEPVYEPVLLPEGVILPAEAEKLCYETVNINAETAHFLTDKTFYVKTPDEVKLFSFDGISEEEIASAECADAKTIWVSENGARMIVSGTDGEMRNKLLFLDAVRGEIVDLSAEDMVMDGTLVGAGYNAESNLLVLNIKENGVYYVCTASLNSDHTSRFITTCFESEAKVTLLCADGNNLYAAVADGSLTQVFRINSNGASADIIKTFDNAPRIVANPAFTHAVLYPAENAVIGFVEIFDPATESVITTDYFNSAISFGASRHSFSADGSYFTINGGSIQPSGGIAVIAAVDYRKSLSSDFAAYADAGRVMITASDYSDKATGGMLTFGELSDSASAELRTAVNGAVAMNNALAQEKCRESGITTQQLLLDSLGVYYSESAKSAIMDKCGISQYGALKYTTGGLTPISVSDTVLVITTNNGASANGLLYVRAGSFGGKPAFLPYSVRLVKENGAWKVDNIIG